MHRVLPPVPAQKLQARRVRPLRLRQRLSLEPLAREITSAISIPTIGIGASPACDGQILVSDDMLGLFNDFKPRFVKHFAELAPLISKATETYAKEVKARTFPGPEHTFKPKK